MDEERDIAVDPVETEAELEERWPAGAWPRFWARQLDTALFVLPAGFIFGLVMPEAIVASMTEGPGSTLIVAILLLPFVLLFDATSMALFGSTPGKRIAGIRVERSEGGKLGWRAFRRNADLYVSGYLFGMPFLNLWGFITAHSAVEADGRTGWDVRTDSWVIARGNNLFRTIAAAGLTALLMIAPLLLEGYMNFQQSQWDREEIVAALPEMNRGLPTFIDEVTRLDRISFTMAEGVMIYDYQLIHRDASAVAADEVNDPAAMRVSLAEGYCAPDMRFFRDRDIPVRHRIRQCEKLHADFLLRASDCRG